MAIEWILLCALCASVVKTLTVVVGTGWVRVSAQVSAQSPSLSQANAALSVNRK